MKRANVGLLEAAEAMEKCSFQPRKALQQLDSQKRAREQAEKAAQRELEQSPSDLDMSLEHETLLAFVNDPEVSLSHTHTLPPQHPHLLSLSRLRTASFACGKLQ